MGQSRRCFTLDRHVSRHLDDQVPLGDRSRFVNDAIRRALKEAHDA